MAHEAEKMSHIIWHSIRYVYMAGDIKSRAKFEFGKLDKNTRRYYC